MEYKRDFFKNKNSNIMMNYLKNVRSVHVFATYGNDRVSNTNTSSTAQWFTVRVTHTSGKTIRTSTWKHLILTDNVMRMASGTDVESVFTARLDHVLVASYTSSLKCLGWNLFLLIWYQMSYKWEEINSCLLVTAIKDTDLWVRYTTAETRPNVRLVLLVTRTLCWTTTHFYFIFVEWLSTAISARILFQNTSTMVPTAPLGDVAHLARMALGDTLFFVFFCFWRNQRPYILKKEILCQLIQKLKWTPLQSNNIPLLFLNVYPFFSLFQF